MDEHLEACVLPLPGNESCQAVRELYGMCPDHDGWHAPGCPEAEQTDQGEEPDAATSEAIQQRLAEIGSGEAPTDQDLVTDHPFEPATFADAWPGICGHLVDGWPCGYSEVEHTQGGEAAGEAP